ncbi:hypothetical protein Vretimale_9150 [Volvox reticuliferus]|uniref:Leucine carboxyl methyltransferase 1 homolog n=1 Tax=Volvox reticuliferus TaxID=1737510 RepID=A0A8J4GCX4_9CHLO|nr:hypothetical protein Vretifemale_9789 [Volvox reticuliferus]GIM04599.1 hypothetical protein Vretimale_9150 [Volvox reticuliferus]
MLRSLEGSDASVQGTNDDAQISKMSCAKTGYFKDEFIQYFVRRASRRSPLINRGYYSRHAALRQLLERFLGAAATSGEQPQVLVLGAGFDTTWFQLCRDKGRAPYRCLEVDFREVTKRKAAIIAKESALNSLLVQSLPLAETVAPKAPESTCGVAPSSGSSSSNVGSAFTMGAMASGAATAVATPTTAIASPAGMGGAAAASGVAVDVTSGTVYSPQYCLQAVDLRNLDALAAAVREAGWDVRLPTYILSECVLVYMEPSDSAAVVHWAAQTFPNAVMAIYEQIRPDDAFGRQMVSNLEMRGCPLKGLPATPTLAAHCARLTGGGWSWAEARDMDHLYRTFLDANDKARVERLEIFDELEEWHMIQEHYCIALGRNDAADWLSKVGFDRESGYPP